MLCDERRLFRAELERARALRNALHKELSRGVGKDLVDSKPFALGRTIQREQPENPLAFAAERLAAGCENTKLRCLANDALDERRHVIQHMFATVEDQQGRAGLQKRQESRRRILRADGQSERRSDGGRDMTGIPQRTEVDEEDAPAEILRTAMPDRDGDRGLADAARADDGHEAIERKSVRDLLDDVFPADHPGEFSGQGAGRGDFGRRPRRAGGAA